MNFVEPRHNLEAGWEEEESSVQASRGLSLRSLSVQGQDEVSSQVSLPY